MGAGMTGTKIQAVIRSRQCVCAHGRLTTPSETRRSGRTNNGQSMPRKHCPSPLPRAGPCFALMRLPRAGGRSQWSQGGLFWSTALLVCTDFSGLRRLSRRAVGPALHSGTSAVYQGSSESPALLRGRPFTSRQGTGSAGGTRQAMVDSTGPHCLPEDLGDSLGCQRLRFKCQLPS